MPSSSRSIWVKAEFVLLPMSRRAPAGEYFSYLDIDSIDNEHQKIREPKKVLTSSAPSRAARAVFSSSTLFSMVRPYLKNIAFVGETNEHCIASTGFFVATPNPNLFNPEFLYYVLTSDYVVNGLNKFMKGDNSPSISADDVKSFVLPIFSMAYQNRCVSLIKHMYGLLGKIGIDQIELAKLSNNLRARVLSTVFTSDKSYYQTKPLGVVFNYIQPGPFIVARTDYSETKTPSHPTPVLTPGKTFILGYTDEKKGIYVPSPKAIIFDDFTTSSKMVDFPFKVKSSAMKILESSDPEQYDIEYYFYRLQTIRPIMGTHKRFWISVYSPIEVEVPKIDIQRERALLFKAVNEVIKRLQQ